MRIAVWHNLPSGGGKRALHDQVAGLIERGHAIEAWCPPSADQSYLPLSSLVEEHVVALDRPGRTNWEKRLWMDADVAGEIAAMHRHLAVVAEEIHAGSFDVVLVHPCRKFRAPALARHVDVPAALYLHEPNRAFYEAQPDLHWLRTSPTRVTDGMAGLRNRLGLMRQQSNIRCQATEEIANAGVFDRLLVNSYFTRESVLRAYGLDSTVCYLGTDLTKFQDAGLARINQVIGLGSYTREKNVALIIRAVACLEAPRPSLVWVGNIADAAVLEQAVALAASLGVAFTPLMQITDEALIELLNTSSAMLYAPRLEPFGLAPIEAAACGLPVVAVAEGGVRETVVDQVTGILVDADPAAIATAVAGLLSDPSRARALGQNGRAIAMKKWSNEAATARLERQLQQVAAAPPKARLPAAID